MMMQQMANLANMQKDIQADLNSSPSKKAHSPVKGVMNALSKHRVSQEPLPAFKQVAKIKGLKVPTRIEDVPFRRQDRRILNQRKRRVVMRRIIFFGVTLGLLLVLLGSSLLALYLLYQDNAQYWYVNPFIVLGTVIIICGVMFWVALIETCIQLRISTSRMGDKEIDSIKNLHHIKHWIDPELIPFGWGHDHDGNDDGIDVATLKDDDVYAGNLQLLNGAEKMADDDEDNNPHLVLKIHQDSVEDEDLESIPKEIFDESLRYSGIDRPKLSVVRSSPVPQRRGSFSDPQEKIAHLFNTSSRSSTS